MKKTLAHVQGPKFILFSAHDGTLLTLFAAMGLTDMGEFIFRLVTVGLEWERDSLKGLVEIPRYAASVSFELYQSGDRAEDAFVKVFYNHEPLPLPQCDGEACSMSSFGK